MAEKDEAVRVLNTKLADGESAVEKAKKAVNLKSLDSSNLNP